MLLIQLTGLSGAGKSTIASAVKEKLHQTGYQVEIIDGDEYRQNLCRDLGFSKEDRLENIRRLGFVAHVLARNNIIAIIAAINPYQSARADLRARYPNVKTVWVQCPLNILQQRDTKGLYRRAMLEEGHPDRLPNLTGVNDPYEVPTHPDLILQTGTESIHVSTDNLYRFIVDSLVDLRQ